MKKLVFIIMIVASFIMASHRASAQEVTIDLFPGWTWISYPSIETMDIVSAMGDFIPAENDIIKSQYGSLVYINGAWRGSMFQFSPGMGYMYYSNRTQIVTVVFSVTSQLLVFTDVLTNITGNSAISGGYATSNDGSNILVKGICWATHQNPTANDDFYTENGNGMGGFTALMTNLTPNTVYYMRAYATSDDGTAYGNETSFTTDNGIPTLTTTNVTGIGSGWAIGGGNISDDGGLPIIARGVCWSTSHNPTIAKPHTIDGDGMESFNSQIYGLSGNTKYYVRAYATNGFTTVYGNEISFTTTTAPTGVINSSFSVSASRKVYFSRGNLQYKASTNTWRLAEHQYDYLGTANTNISSTYRSWIDLFGWGTSGWNSGNTYYQPWNTANSGGSLYGPPGSYNMTGNYANSDWGVYNSISNGGNQSNQWRTLTKEEWTYVFETRNTVSGIRYAMAKIGNVNGVILLPDGWNTSVYSLNNPNTNDASYSSNTLTAAQWSILEQAGAVFLPAAGYRYGVSILDVGSKGCYWSASYCDSGNSFGLFYYDSFLNSNANFRRDIGLSVRLIRVQ